MNFKFTIIDYTTNPAGISTVVDEPIGYDTVAMRLKRDTRWHGFFDFWDDSYNTMQWHGTAAGILRNAYITNGVQANCNLKVEIQCNDTWETVYEGRFNFAFAKYTCGDYCTFECGVEATSCIMTMRNRYDQKVDLDTDKTFDTEDTLPAYDGLGKEITLPSIPILLKNDWAIDSNLFEYTDDILFSETPGMTGNYLIPFNWHIDNLTDIDDSDRSASVYAQLGSVANPVFENQRKSYSGIVELNPDTNLECIGQINVDIEMSGEIRVNSVRTIQFTGSIFLYYGNEVDGYTAHLLQGSLGCASCTNVTHTVSITDSLSINIKKGDRVYLQYVIVNAQYLTSGSQAFDVEIQIDSASLKIEATTTCERTSAQVYMINEALSRTTEVITNDCLRVYSDYFGRTDAEPYASDETGCGGMESITSGIKIRTKEIGKILIGTDDKPAKCYTSLRDLFEGLDAIHAIGMGIETDPNRLGYDMLRVEPFPYFYQDTLHMTFDGVREIKTEFNQSLVYNLVKMGYAKWETENKMGLNDVHGQREYATGITQVRNTFERICRFIASNYAIEVTRRKYGITTTDWRYDNDTFIICLTERPLVSIVFTEPSGFTINERIEGITAGDVLQIDGTSFNDGTYTVSVVAVTDNATSIITTGSVTNETVTCFISNQTSPFYLVERNGASFSNVNNGNKLYNIRVTPARNIIRQLRHIFRSYRDFLTGQIKFTSGTGNVDAISDIVVLDCLLESGGILENQNIDITNLADDDLANPIFRPELIRFEYPCSFETYLSIKANRYKRYGFSGSNCSGSGWIEDLQYKPAQGMASFVLKPKIES